MNAFSAAEAFLDASAGFTAAEALVEVKAGARTQS
jgi:hypothetical protein